MLSRVSRPKAVSKSIRNRVLYYQNLQTLLPACYGPPRATRFVSLNKVLQRPRSLEKKEPEDVLTAPARRQMATAMSYNLDEIPFQRMTGSISSVMNSSSGGGLSHTPYNVGPISLLGVGESSHKSLRRGKLGLSGDLEEIVPVFEACIQIGRLERARDILEKLYEKALIAEHDAVQCFNTYLRAAVEHAIVNHTSEVKMQELHIWFQLHKEVKLVPYNAETIGYMVKLSLQSEKGRRERLVQRYLDLLNEETFLDLIVADVLTGQEIGLVTEICPKYKFALDFEEEVHEVESNENTAESEASKNRDVATVLATKQKGLGLSSLRKTLSLFHNLPIEGIDLSTASNEEKINFQKCLEQDAVESAIERWRDENETLLKMGLNSALQNKSLAARMWKWHMDLVSKLEEELQLVHEAEAKSTKSREELDRCLYGPLLRILPTQQVAAVTIIACMTMMGQHTEKRTPLSAVVLEIGKNIEDESTLYTLLQAEKKEMWPPKDKRRLNPEFYIKLKRTRGAGAASRHMNRYYADSGAKPWPASIRAKVGAILMSLLVDVAKVPVYVKHPETNEDLVQIQSAFTHAHQYRKGRKTGIVLMNKVLLDQLRREPVHSLLAKQLPMIVQPNKWTAFSSGGYIAYPSKAMRIKLGDQEQRQYCDAAVYQGNMEKIFEGLDVLGKTSWMINKPVFNVMLEAWNSGESIANFPSMNPKLDIPPEPVSTTDPLERGRWIRQVKIAHNIKIGLHSQRCFQNFQLEIARAYRDQKFYFPHNIDFRGRAYPIPPYLNHIGADHCRGLLMFGTGKELGENGLRWLKIHISNVFGFDKASLQERENFTTSKLEEIFDSAMNPLTGKKWWLKAEDPWQCLAASMELKNALDSPEPTKYVSYLPIHQDGTCNGLQHYAALGGDVWGAKQVNLEPGDRPADVYTAVAELVRESIAKDKAAGIEIAEYLDGKITRKTVKQTVMTNVYGVTFIGASAQVRKQLASSYPDLQDNEKLTRHAAAAYIAKKIFSALSTMFRGAHDIQYWLADCASKITSSVNAQQLTILEGEWENIVSTQAIKKISAPRHSKDVEIPDIDELTVFKSSVIWTSPLGMPVVQPYRVSKGKAVRTRMQNINLSAPHRNNPVSQRKQLQGFPPNFIHSLDASHMILSAIGCDKRGLSFAAVHDSFWTHACDVETMSDVLRDCFIEIHNDNIIGRLAAEFKTRYQNSMYLARVYAKPLFAEKIREWRTSQRSLSQIKTTGKKAKDLRFIEELLMETKRRKLLASSDPAEVQKGKDMVTPGSIYEDWLEESGKSHLIDDNDENEDMLRSANKSTDQKSDVQLVLEENDESKLEDINAEVDSEDDEDREGEQEGDYGMNIDIEDLENEKEELCKFEKGINHSASKRRAERVIQIWLPVKFKEIPKKGAFDVSRLKQSKYFFS